MNICRLCLSFGVANIPLHCEKSLVLFKIRYCLPLIVQETDGLPDKICMKCQIRVEEFYEYYTAVLINDKQLRTSYDSGIESLNKLYKTIEEKAKIKVETVKSDTCQYSIDNKENEINILLDQNTETNNFDPVEIDEKYKNYIQTIKTESAENLDDNYVEAFYDYTSDDNLTLSALKTIKLEQSSESKSKEKKRKAKHKRKKNKKNDFEDVSNDKKTEHISTRINVSNKRKKCIEPKNPDKCFFPEGTPDEDKSWQCLTCSVYLDSRPELLQHYKTLHGDAELDKSNFRNGVSDKKAESNETSYKVLPTLGADCKQYACLQCDKRFDKQKSVIRHLLSHIKARPFVCNVCGRTYRTASEILLHGRAHNGYKTLFCRYEQCSYSTVYPGALSAHERRHAPEYKYKCEVCNKGFHVRTWFQEHRNVHSGEKPFACEICGKAFHLSRYLTSHRSMVHAQQVGRKLLHVCRDCGKKCDSRRALTDHLKEHGVDGCVLCDMCGAALASSKDLKLHRRMHLGVKPHTCKTCGKGFVKKCNLTLHERVHSGEKPHVCSHCGKAFSQRSTLVIHTRYHTGARPYQCCRCSKGFVARGLLSAHQRTCS